MILQYTKNYNLRKTEEYKHLSRRAVEVFNLLLDRYQSSVKNGYSDENGTYVKYGQKEMAWDLDCEDRTIRNAIRQLEESGLVKTVRQFKRQVNKMYLNIPEKLTPLRKQLKRWLIRWLK
jgi:DNA-binding MarR family transcriptional regulator